MEDVKAAESGEVEVEQEQEQQPAQPAEKESEFERVAKALGWTPKEQFKGSEDEWQDAEAFITRTPKVIDKLRKKVSKFEHTVTHMQEHMGKVEEMAYKRAIADLQKEKKEAVREGDEDRVEALDKEIDELKEAKTKPAQAEPGISPEVKDWVDKNPWYLKDRKMARYCEGVVEDLRQEEPDASIEDVLDKAAKEVKRRFPEAFENKERTKPPVVESGSGPAAGGKRKYTYSDLSETQREVVRGFRSAGLFKGAYTEQKYIDELAEMGELGKR